MELNRQGHVHSLYLHVLLGWLGPYNGEVTDLLWGLLSEG